MAVHQITILDTGETFRCPGDRDLLAGMEALGRRGIPVGCRNGGCGVCKIRVVRGTYQTRVMSRDHVTEEEEAAGIVLACRVRPTSDVELAVIGKMKEQVCGTGEPRATASSNP